MTKLELLLYTDDDFYIENTRKLGIKKKRNYCEYKCEKIFDSKSDLLRYLEEIVISIRVVNNYWVIDELFHLFDETIDMLCANEKTINKKLYGNYDSSYLKIYEIKEINYE